MPRGSPRAEDEHVGFGAEAGGANASSHSAARRSRRSSQGAQVVAAAHAQHRIGSSSSSHSSAHHDAYSHVAPVAATSEQAHEFTAGASSSITVLVRVRPLSTREIEEDTRSVVNVIGANVVTMLAPIVAQNDYLRAGRVSEKRFAFDSAWSESTSQSTIYAHATKNLIPGVLAGFNATAFAYGATGSGKTYSMSGGGSSSSSMDSDAGIMVRTLSDLFAQIAAIEAEGAYKYQISLSLVELYNENIRDLLVVGNNAHGHGNHAGEHGGSAPATELSSPSHGGAHATVAATNNPHTNPNSLDLREDSLRGMVIAGVTEVRDISSSDQILALLQRGNRNRTTEPTQANEVSSRSHQVLTIQVERHDASPGGSGEIKVGKLNLIDLAGSERASKTQNRGVRLTEGANINRSLLSLANVINSLATGAETVNYRDSKLTRLLKDSLGGHCKTVMIACVSPAESSYEETLNTLHYADRAKSIKTRQSSNEKTVATAVHQMEAVIRALRKEIQTLKGELWQAHQGQAPLSPPIAAAPQHRLSRIPSVSRPSLSLLIPAGPKSLLLPELITEEGSPLSQGQQLAMFHAQQRGAQTQANTTASPSRLQQPSNFSSLPSVQQHQPHQQQQPAHGSPSHRQSSRKNAHRRRTHTKQQQQQPGGGGGGAFFPPISPAAAAAASPTRGRGPRQEIDSFLSVPTADSKAISDALQFLRQPESTAVGNALVQDVGSVVLPPELGPTLDAWPFDLLRRLQSKLWNDLLHARSRLVGEALRPEVAARQRLQFRSNAQAAAAGHEALSSDLESLRARLGVLHDLGSKLRHRCALKQALGELVFSKLKLRIEHRRRQEEANNQGRMPLLLPSPSSAVSAADRDDTTMPAASQARKSLSVEWRAFCASHNKLLADEAELRSQLSVHTMREQLERLESLVASQDDLISRQLLTRLADDDPQRAEVDSIIEQTHGVLDSVKAMAARDGGGEAATVITSQQAQQAIKLQRQQSQLAIADGSSSTGHARHRSSHSHKKHHKHRSSHHAAADGVEGAKLFHSASSPQGRSQKKTHQPQLPSPSSSNQQHSRSSNVSPTRGSAHARANRASLPQGGMLPAIPSPANANGAYRASSRVPQ